MAAFNAFNADTTHPCPVLEPPVKRPPSLYSTRLAFIEAACRASVLANIAMAITLCAVLAWTHSVYRASLVREVHFFAVDSAGGLSPVNPDALKFHPTDQILRSFLMRFTKEHAERVRASVVHDYGHSLLFMDRALTAASIEKDVKEIKAFKAGLDPEIRVRVGNVTLQMLSKDCADNSAPTPCLATVQYEKEYFDRNDQHLIETKRFSASLQFVLKAQITNDMVEDNPIGLIVTRYHEDEGWI